MEYEPLQRCSKEFYDLMRFFEENVTKAAYVYDTEKEDKNMWERRAYYKNGKTNEMWLVFMLAYEHGKHYQYDVDNE